MVLVPSLQDSISTLSGSFLVIFFCCAVSSCVYDHNHPHLVYERLFVAEKKAFFPPESRGAPAESRAILWDALATEPVVIFVAVAPKQVSPKMSVSWLTLYGLVDRLPVSAGNFGRALQHHFSVDFQNQVVAGKIFSCYKRECFCFCESNEKRPNSVRSNFAKASISQLIDDWGRSTASEALQRHLSVDFQNQDVSGKIFSCCKRARFAFVTRTRNGRTASARSLPTHWFRNWSKTEAALQRQRDCSVIFQ